jgi:hypothetical protein
MGYLWYENRINQNRTNRGFDVLIFKKYPHSGMNFINIGTAFGIYKLSLSRNWNESIYKLGFMKTLRNRMILLLALSIGTIVGIFRGNEAKQKWVFRIRSRFDEKRQMAEQKKLIRGGGVALDDIELAAFHNN